jgi:hypothetical protein
MKRKMNGRDIDPEKEKERVFYTFFIFIAGKEKFVLLLKIN